MASEEGKSLNAFVSIYQSSGFSYRPSTHVSFDQSPLKVSGPTVSFASLTHQQFDNTKKALGSSQMQRAITHLTTCIHICPKLQQQLRHLQNRRGPEEAQSTNTGVYKDAVPT